MEPLCPSWGVGSAKGLPLPRAPGTFPLEGGSGARPCPGCQPPLTAPLGPQVHVGGSLAVLGGKLYVSGGYDNTFELSDVVEAYDPETRAWSVVGRLPEPTFWHGSVSIFRQFMPQTPLGRGFELDSGSGDMGVGRPRPPQDPAELH